jgi:hypothetical protein
VRESGERGKSSDGRHGIGIGLVGEAFAGDSVGLGVGESFPLNTEGKAGTMTAPHD